jgi:hypothetical protein
VVKQLLACRTSIVAMAAMDSLLSADAEIADNSAGAGCSPTAPTTNAIGVPKTPTDVLPSAALRPDGAIDH